MRHPGTQSLVLGEATIGIITALPHELAAARAVFHCESVPAIPSSRGRIGVSYHLTAVNARSGGSHIVAISTLNLMGTNTAASAATHLLIDCPKVKEIIMVGIAGGVPSPDDPESHVRLGDVVVSNENGVVQFDLGKQQEIKGFTYRGAATRPSPVLLNTVRNLQAEAELGNFPWEGHICAAASKYCAFSRPAAEDILIDDVDVIPHPDDSKWRREGQPRIFLGRIGSSNLLLKDAKFRDQLRNDHQIRAVEMEAAGVVEATWLATAHYLIIRGACDYCNKNKNNDWQRYAAIAAAAYAKAVVEFTPVTTEPTDFTLFANPGFAQALAKISHDLTDVKNLLGVSSEHRPQPDATLAQEEVERLTEELPRAWKLCEYETAARMARRLESLVWQREDRFTQDVVAAAYVALANSAVNHAVQAAKGDIPDMSEAKRFIQRAKDVAR